MVVIRQTTKELNALLRMDGKVLLNDTTPAAPSGKVNIAWQTDVDGNISANVSTPGAGSGAVLVNETFASTIAFDGSTATAFEVDLTGNVTGSTFVNGIAGQLYTFILVQDATGSHTFAYPTNFHSPTSPSATANSITTITGICRANGNVYFGTYN